MTRPSLAGIEQRAAEATAEPWVVNGPAEQWAVISSGHDSVIHAYTVHDPDCESCTCGGDEAGHVAISVEDAAFITAAHTVVPALTAAVRDVLAVLDRHERDNPLGREQWNADIRDALAAHLDLTDPEGDPT